ncbi:OLC1v1025527C1 [Oldenlandia corymbosa var. corymbosa]|uniref:DNA (cytosine-5-)-methyltransferase n=1 Tax=Oldenlandia corymbosa var. corymbosa TaxID=529605 RepID=A0AAV1C7D6_OLDCO|nr:OLC1v1025527C1 [Oldenlandia corymbosa var. corymbosa]
MPKELPGFYYDEEKNRYFPIKGPIPGSSRKRKIPSSSSSDVPETPASQVNKIKKSMRCVNKLLQSRELCGNLIPCRTRRLNFQTEYKKKLASVPMIWKYQGTENEVANAVEQLRISVNGPIGVTDTDVLLAGGLNGILRVFPIGEVGPEYGDEGNCKSECVWPTNIGSEPEWTNPWNLLKPFPPSILPSEISCIRQRRHMPVDEASARDVLVTTMGSGASRGVVFLFDFSGPVEYGYACQTLASVESTIWAAESCSRDQVVIGTDRGATLIGVETGLLSHILRCKSDVFSLQVDHSGKNILCGLRNGAIALVDTRQKCQVLPSQRHHASSGLKLQTKISCNNIHMPSSVSCLKCLQLSDQYFIASSMDGSMKLYDQRLIQKGAVQSYDGNVNAHTHIQFGVDPLEEIVVSGGDDCNLRLWSIKSGEMLFQGKFMSSVPAVVCWPEIGGISRKRGLLRENYDYWEKFCEWGVWVGSRDGLFYVDWELVGRFHWEIVTISKALDSEKMDNDDCDSIDWNTDDELEISNVPPGGFSLSASGTGACVLNGAESSSARSANIQLIQRLLVMGFPDKLVMKAIEEHGEDTAESTIVEAILTYQTLEQDTEEQKCTDVAESSSDYDESQLYLSESDSWADICSEDEENNDFLSEKDKKRRTLERMGFSVDDAEIAIERCPEASVDELSDFILAAQIAREESANLPAQLKPKLNYSCGEDGKRKKHNVHQNSQKSKKQRQMLVEEGPLIRLPKPMIGFGVPSSDFRVTERNLPEQAIGPPYFYYENVALTPQGVWDTISRFLYDIEPEFVDSKYFCAAARKRGYVHNLPIKNRFELLPTLPLTIREAFPLTNKWWPSWDTRTHLNCLQTAIGSARLQERIRKAVEGYNGDPPEHVKKYVMYECRKWNLLWVGRNKVAPLEPDEFEILLGFPKHHTRGGGMSRTDRYKSLGNSFQVNTVAYHLSVLKPLFPDGINVLSLFSGIGGGEVALHRLGIRLKNVVSVEKSECNRDIVRSWWEQTNQRGNLYHLDDVQSLDADELERWIDRVGGFDLIIGGSPCNNLAGSNRVSRDGLEGKESSLFYDYFRILDAVRSSMRR